jgi:hypothetical protein
METGIRRFGPCPDVKPNPEVVHSASVPFSLNRGISLEERESTGSRGRAHAEVQQRLINPVFMQPS